MSALVPTEPRDAFTLRVALTVGRLDEDSPHRCRVPRQLARHPFVHAGTGICPRVRQGGLVRHRRPGPKGAQAPGFLTPWLQLAGFEDRLRWLSAVTDLDLVHYGTEADADTIRDTAVAQPLLVASGLVSLLSLFPHPADAFGKVSVGAGHSVGEITAAAAAGVMSAEQAMVFVRERGKAMAAAAAVTATGMTAVALGGDQDTVVAIEKHNLTPANINGAGQIVAAGTMDDLARFNDDPPEALASVRCQWPARSTPSTWPPPSTRSAVSPGRSLHDARTQLISNADGMVVQSGRDYLARLVQQVSNPVRGPLHADHGRPRRHRAHRGATSRYPGWAGQREPADVEVVALKTPDDLEAARELVARHGVASQLDSTPTWRMLVVQPLREFPPHRR